MPEETMSDALSELESAIKEHEKAQLNTAKAGSEEAAAVNRLNAAQKRLDELVADIKKSAPRDSNWGRLGRKAVPVTQ